MITQQAKKGIEAIFLKAARSNLAKQDEGPLSITLLPEAVSAPFSEKTIIVLTISSFVFRLLTIFHIDENAATEAYFKAGSSDMSLVDVVSELGNLCCGAMNRELLKSFGHLGMSTPYTLGREVMDFIPDLKPGHIARFEIKISEAVSFHVTLCMCENAPIDFRFDEAHEEETGALELF